MLAVIALNEMIMNKDYLLHKWLNKEASPEELESLKSSPEYASYIKISETSSGLEAPIPNSEANFESIRLRLNEKEKVRKLNLFPTVLKFAAALAVVIAGYLYINSLDTSFQTQIAEKQSILLPDNSEVNLNASSQLSYNKGDWSTKRELNLEGEAYFKVSKGNTFTVNTSLGKVSVLGTQFNVFVRNESFYVDCFEGLVSVKFGDTLIKLPAGSGLKIEQAKLLTHYQTFQSAPSWISNESSFDNTSLTFVLEELERQYPIKLTANISNMNIGFTGSFTHNDLNLALRSICEPLGLTFTVQDESVTIYAKENPQM